MLLNELPLQIEPEKLCRDAPPEGRKLSGQILLSKLTNLAKELKAQKDKVVTVSLVFSIDNVGLCSIVGDMAVDLELICQRCLQPMLYQLCTEVRVSPVVSDTQAEHLPAHYEPLLVTNGEITLAEWIAEELHLALPLAPRHEPPCVSFSAKDEKEGSGSSSSKKPFAKLINLK
jgi:uncharacterized protein